MPEPPDGIAQLRGVARRLLWGAAVCLLLPAMAWLGTALYESSTASGGSQLAGLAGILLVVARVGLVLLALGLAATGWAWWLGRDGAGREG